MKKINLILLIIVTIGSILRFYNVWENPPGLYIDEVSGGYNSYTILQRGEDEHGNKFPVFFKAFGEYKMPLYVYATSGAIGVFGKNEFAIRFTSVMCGILSLFMFYFLIKKLLELDKTKLTSKIKSLLPIVSTFLLSISSWHIHFSRGGFEANLALLLYISAIYFFLLYIKKHKNIYLIGLVLLLALTPYTYNIYRIIAPATLMLLFAFILNKSHKTLKYILPAMILFLVLFIPIIQFSLTEEGLVRFTQTSAFSEYKQDSLSEKIYVYPMVYLKNYLSFFSFDFLFNFGDGNGRHQVPGFGLLYRWQFPFLLIGFYYLMTRKKSVLKYCVLLILLLTPLGASVAVPSPHSLRALPMVIPLAVFTACGLIVFFEKIKKLRKGIIALLGMIVFYEFIIYAHFYYFHYPNVNALDWGAGYKEMAEKTISYKKNYDYIVIDKNLNYAQIYFKFYDETVEYDYVDVSWVKPKKWENKKVLYIRPFYGQRSNPDIIENVYLPGPNKDIFAQFWRL
jgi:4-amino-4-deoxy-L-arabinose transferase-like glycosyltransferase